ncbi:MAG: DUF4331 domain-containing protein [Dehalococcoidia bacterium]
MKRTIGLLGAVAAVALGVTTLASWHNGPAVDASSHREAPIIATDPEADGTDLYAFISPDRPDFITFIMSYNPLEAPDGGPNFYKFGDNVLYSLKIDNDHDGEEDITYEWRFKTTTRNPNTFLYNLGPVTRIDDPNLNVYQTYSLWRTDKGAAPRQLIADVPVAPVNLGKNSFPNYDAVAAQAVVEVPNTGGARVFAGPTDDPFWVDLAIFDLLQAGKPPRDSLAGFNVHTIALQAPITRFTKGGVRPTDPSDPAAVIGVWMTSSRRAVQVINANGSRGDERDWVQVSRLGHPLVNEVVGPRAAKDLFNASQPKDDGQFLAGVTDPELAALMNAVLNFPAPKSNRSDLVSVFLTAGVDGLTKPNVPAPSMPRRSASTSPCRPRPTRSRWACWRATWPFPNGRRLTDEVVDISLRRWRGVRRFQPRRSARTSTNDKPFRTTPYVAAPHAGGLIKNSAGWRATPERARARIGARHRHAPSARADQTAW